MQSPVIVGRILRNRYRIVRQLGSGGFGVTYLAEDKDLPGKPKCVVKHFKPRHSERATLSIAKNLFDKEAAVLYKLGQDHDQIPQLFAHFEEDGEFYLVQEYIHGHNLATEIRRDRQLSEREVFSLLFGILGVLSVVHQHGVIHRDIKPPNLMRRYRDGKIVLIDFGAVKEIGTLTVDAQGQTSLTVAVGSSGYMPDEQANGKPKLCSDVYAVGMIGIQALTGITPSKLPENPETGEVIWRDRANVSDSLANVLDTMVRPHFSQRYRSAAEALQGLLTAVALAMPQSTDAIDSALSSQSPSSEMESASDIPMDYISASSYLSIVDTPASYASATSETVVLSDMVTSMSPPESVAAADVNLTTTPDTIVQLDETPTPQVPAMGKAGILQISSQRLTQLGLGIGGVAIAIAAIVAGLIFSRSSTPERSGIATTEAIPTLTANHPKPSPKPPQSADRGKIALRNGIVYEGDLANGKPSGKGKVTAATYYCVGDFRNGELNGQGFCNYTNGDRYEGEFRNDKFNGKGKIKYATGDRYEGEFRNDKIDGKGILIHKNGDREEGFWQDGLLVEPKKIN